MPFGVASSFCKKINVLLRYVFYGIYRILKFPKEAETLKAVWGWNELQKLTSQGYFEMFKESTVWEII